MECQDIDGELAILDMVLKDQQEIIDEMRKMLYKKGRGPWDENKVLANLQARIQWMRDMNDKNRKTLLNLLKLKQAQSTVEQSRLANRSSKMTVQQLGFMKEQAEKTTDQLKAMREQAVQTEKQSQTLMVFTVVTVIFVRFPMPPSPQLL